jgi:hypothetical protein
LGGGIREKRENHALHSAKLDCPDRGRGEREKREKTERERRDKTDRAERERKNRE